MTLSMKKAQLKIKRWYISSPFSTQAVESCVKLVTEASQNVINSEARDGFY